MSTSTRPAPTQTPPDSVDFSLAEVPRRIYAFFYNKKVGLFLILLMGVLTLLGTLFPQVPDAMRDSKEGVAAFVESVRPRYRGLTDVLAFLGVFQMFSSWAFKIASGALAASILACTCHRFPNLWKQATKPHTHVKPAFFDHARLHTTTITADKPAVVLQRAQKELKRAGFRVLSDEHGSGYGIYADRFRWSPFGTIVAHIAFIVILVGVVVTGTFGVRLNDVSVPVGGSTDIGHGSGLSVQAVAFTDTYQPDGRPKDYASELVLLKNGTEVARHTVRVNSPLTYDGWAFNQSTYGLAAQISVQGKDGAAQTQTVPLNYQTDDGQMVYGTFTLDGSPLEYYVIAPASGSTGGSIAPGQVRLELYTKGSNQAMTSQLLSQGKPANVGDKTITFDRERQYTGLMASRDPGAPIIWLGALLIMVGICMSMFFRHHRLWLDITPAEAGSELRIASPDRHDSIFERRVQALATTLSQPAKEPADA